MDYLALFNGLGKRVKPHTYRTVTRLEERLQDNGLDSLDVVLLCVYACEVFGIPEAVGKSLNPATFADIVRFVEQHRTRVPESVEAALGLVDG
jgi:acyl carrier protein